MINLDLRDAVEKHGLFYPPDPSSYDWCTIGGNLSTNAGGLCCVKYGVTTDSVLGLEVVLADGSLLRTGRRTVKGVAGYDLTKLFVGSEGTLGVITRATLALRPLPQAPGTLFAAFSSTEAAGDAVSRVVREGIVPSLMEIMDATSISAVEEHLKTELGAGKGCQALLICQSDSGGEAARRELGAIEQVCLDAGADLAHCTYDPAEGQLLLAARRAVLMALEVYGAWLTDDVCVPRTRIAELIAGCARVSAEVGLRIAVVGHAGDGNMHPTIVYDPASEDEFARAHQAFDDILAIGLALGGTVTGEHGVGKIKREWLAKEIGPVAHGRAPRHQGRARPEATCSTRVRCSRCRAQRSSAERFSLRAFMNSIAIGITETSTIRTRIRSMWSCTKPMLPSSAPSSVTPAAHSTAPIAE